MVVFGADDESIVLWEQCAILCALGHGRPGMNARQECRGEQQRFFGSKARLERSRWNSPFLKDLENSWS